MFGEVMQTNFSDGFGHWILKFEIYLKFGACDLVFFALILGCHFP
jgi:hypothetical protein